MSSQSDPLPPVPQQVPALVKDKIGLDRFQQPWMQWFTQLRDKINVINESLTTLGIVTDIGFLAKQSDGSWASRLIEDSSNIEATSGDGSANPSLDLTVTGVTAGTYGSATKSAVLVVDNKGRITGASEATISGGGGGSVTAGTQIGYAYTESSTVASTTSTTLPVASIPQNTNGVAYASLDTTITPNEAGSLLEVEIFVPIVSGSGSGVAVQFALFRDSDVNAIATSRVNTPSTDYNYNMGIRIKVPANAAVATTFKLRWGVSSGTGYILRTGATASFFGGSIKAVMMVREIKQ
jgi:hypothetical protein